MAQINVKIDEDVKKNAERVLKEIGMSTSTAVTIFLKAVDRMNGFPFDLVIDPITEESSLNMNEKEHKNGIN